jgi:SAM-dependent methyltransferase
MKSLIKFLARKLLSVDKLRNIYCFLRVFYFCKLKNNLKNFEEITDDTWKYTLDSNKRAIYNKNINLPKHPRANRIFEIGKSLDGSKSKWLLEVVNKRYKKSEFKSLKVLSIGPRSEGEIYKIFASGFELNNIVGLDLFSYSPFIKLGDMHNLEFSDSEFHIIFMGWCLAYSNNKSKALSEVKRVLKKNGLLVIGHSTLEKTQDQIIASRGYLVGSPNEMIENLENLEYMIKNINLKRFYAKTIQLVNSKRIIYGATK